MKKIRYTKIDEMVNINIDGYEFTFNPDDTMRVSSDNYGDTTFDPRVIVDMDDEFIYID